MSSSRFEAIRTLTGGEVFDSDLGRPVDLRPSFSQAEALAAKLNRTITPRIARRDQPKGATPAHS